MKRFLGYGFVAAALGLVVTGCPVYPREPYCYDDYDCPSDYYCRSDSVCVRIPPDYSGYAGYSGGYDASTSGQCASPAQCGANSTCGKDGLCHTGDCSFWQCVPGYQCSLVDSHWTCLPQGGTGGSAGSGPKEAGKDATRDASDSGPDDGGARETGTPEAGPEASAPEAEAAAPVYCGNPKDCPSGWVCTSSGVCQQGSCSSLGCISGFVCTAPDAGEASCLPTNPAACQLDGDCASLGAGYKCVDKPTGGICTAPSDQCWDKSQCPGASASCVGGKCITACKLDTTCPTGFKCDTTLGVCTIPAQQCSTTQDCDSTSLVCVAGACVQRCEPTANGCPQGLVCVANGCVPDQSPTFTCNQDGQQDVCQTGSICLNHSCYIGCEDADAQPCANQYEFNICKTVTTTSGAHKVCGSATNLGTDCDPTQGLACPSGKICIDGFCR